MHKLFSQNGSYYIPNEFKRPFRGMYIDISKCKDAISFAYEMVYGNGYHRKYRSGGQIQRNKCEQFCNTFQGKLAEICLKDLFITNDIECGKIDYNVYSKGKWDDVDLIVNDYSISIKSAASFSNLLLLESKDFDENGHYLPNFKIGATFDYDYYVLVRIFPDIKFLFRNQNLLFSNEISKEKINEIISKQILWLYDIGGWISHSELINIIQERNIIPQNSLLNRKTGMNAENYYILTGDMHHIDELISTLKTNKNSNLNFLSY